MEEMGDTKEGTEQDNKDLSAKISSNEPNRKSPKTIETLDSMSSEFSNNIFLSQILEKER